MLWIFCVSPLSRFTVLISHAFLQKSEDMKKAGNEAFAKEKFDIAVTFYTTAIELW